MSIEHYRDIKARNWWVRTVAGAILDSVETNEVLEAASLDAVKKEGADE